MEGGRGIFRPKKKIKQFEKFWVGAKDWKKLDPKAIFTNGIPSWLLINLPETSSRGINESSICSLVSKDIKLESS